MQNFGPRQHAEDCLRRARGASALESKALLLQMAETWLTMAETTEKVVGPISRGRGKGIAGASDEGKRRS